MTMMTKILAGGAGLAALAAAAPATAQYYGGYSYGAPYGNAYGYNNANVNAAAQRCTAAVQQRLSMRGRTGILSILGLGAPTSARVLSVTQVTPRANTVRVRGLATSNAYASYGPYGVGAYGALGYGYAQPRANLSFSCSVDYNGYIRDVDINRR